jgi:hypothetical protein
VSKKLEFDAETVQNRTIDTWAEILVLAESTCLVLSKSMFVFAASFMRDPEACSVPIQYCSEDHPSHIAGTRKYFGENTLHRKFALTVDADASPLSSVR